MPVIMRAGNWWIWVGLVCAVLVLNQQDAVADPSVLKEVLLTHLMPGDAREPVRKEESTVDKLLSNTWKSVEQRTDDDSSSALRIPWRTPQGAHARGSHASWNTGLAPLPGFLSSSRVHAGGVRVASAGPMLPAIDSGARTLLDADDEFSSAGSLVGNPSTLFASFEILVNIHTYKLELYGTRTSSKRELLYSCGVGLGSPEYPTPRGSYYISIIYDDRPLWIPPPRDWAYGQEPSHSVYGGHMMPFYTKTAVRSGKNDQIVEDLDNIASPVKMVDGGMYRIHGTDSPWSIGSSQSHGCVRMLNKTVKRLADTLKLYVGVGPRARSANGSYVTLIRPVRLVLY